MLEFIKLEICALWRGKYIEKKLNKLLQNTKLSYLKYEKTNVNKGSQK